MATSVVGLASTLRRLRDDPGVQLLRADLMPVVVAILHSHLGGTPRQLSAVEFLDLLSDDLDELRDAGFDLPRPARDYLNDWVRTGFLIRRAGAGREETVELSPAASLAVRFAASLEAPHSSVTSSRLAMLTDALAKLARDTDPEAESRLEALRAERDRIDAEMAEVAAGRYQPLADGLAVERLADILSQADAIPADFAQVSSQFESLNHDLREQIVQHSGSRGDVLDHIFGGVDLIEESDAGRTFAAFYSLVLDADQAARFDASVADLLERPFSTALTAEEVAFLRRLLTTLQNESTQVRAVMTGFSRSLRRFVETHAYREHRRLADALAAAERAVLEASGVMKLYAQTGYQLDASSVPLASIGSWSLHNPADVRTAEPVATVDAAPLDLAALREQVRASEIDFAELRAAVIDTLGRLSVASIGDVLADHPASQGLASVVGLLVLADSAGTRTAASETLSWASGSGQTRTVSAPRYVFTEVPQDWRARVNEGSRR